jgi:16S rRNA processing protein RimM
MTSSRDSGDLVAVGRIVGVHGIRGELKVEPLTDFPERFAPGVELLLVSPTGEVRPAKVLTSRTHKGRVLLQMKGVADRTAAEALRGGFFKVEEDDLAPLPEGRYYHFQLVGLEVFTESGERLGDVKEVVPTGGNLVLIVHDGVREVLLPFIDDVVREVDREAGRITVHLLEGLLPDGQD